MFQFERAPGGTPGRDTALACLAAAVDAALPASVVPASVSLDGERLRVDGTEVDLGRFDRVLVLGGGKAAAGVAAELESILGDRIDGGAVVVPESDADGVNDREGGARRVARLPGSHPVPSARGVESTRRVLDLAGEADERTLVLAVVTGGASALLAAPADVPLAALQETTDALLASGADIAALNAVRKHLSAVKGGGLASLAAPATVLTLAFSDVVGDDPGVIGSGPTAPDETTFADACAVLERYGIDPPTAVRERLDRGVAGEIPETPGPGDPVFDRVETAVLADGFRSLAAARRVAADRGYTPVVLSSRVRGEAREAAKTHVAIAEEARSTGNPVAPPAVLLSGGETTVTVTGGGEGGPNLEFALSAAVEIGGADGITVASVDSDGLDGGTAAAGAVVDADAVADLDAARAALAANDALSALRAADSVVWAGATGTNVNDLRVVVVDDPGGRRATDL